MTPEQLLAEADRCVKCGYCLPHCPTYALKADEGESPRGRIALIQALTSGALNSKRLHLHLDSCLACRACEAACPSEVRYGQMITSARAIQRDGNRALGILDKTILHTLSHAPYSQSMSGLAGIYQKFGLASAANLLGGDNIARLNKLLPTHIETIPWKESYPAAGTTIGRVGLFTGCISRITDRTALDASIHILNRIGYEVIVPADQGCCGAMHMHSGDSGTANDMAGRNHAAFCGLDLDAIVGVASGCSAHIKEHSENDLSTLMTDISAFLGSIPEINRLKLKPLKKKVAIHTPCSMKNVLKQTAAPFRLLELIPEIEIVELPDNGLCCGAAGLYLIEHPQEADALRNDKIEGLKISQAEILITSNTGCALHLAAGIRANGMDVEVMHPVELLARQIAA